MGLASSSISGSGSPRPIFIAGPTAVGKSSVALALARMLGGEIISVDSMQVYRGLDIGTAKPTVHEQQLVWHHLVDILELTDLFDAARFVDGARAAVCDIQARGCVPIFCGGTGLYFKAFTEGLGEAPPANAAVRAELEATPLPELLVELEKTDPVTFAKIDRQNPRRVIRALEVIRCTGKPFSNQRADWMASSGEGKSATRLPAGWNFGLDRTREDLNERINKRVDQMFADGLVAETAKLLEHGLAENRTAMQALGYRQVVEHLRGERPLSETIELVKIRTRQFAKRQLTWFRRQMNLEWMLMEPVTNSADIAEQIAEKYRAQNPI